MQLRQLQVSILKYRLPVPLKRDNLRVSCMRRSNLMLAVFFVAAMAAVATAANAPVTSADLVTPGDQYPMPTGLDSWSSVLADVFMQKVIVIL